MPVQPCPLVDEAIAYSLHQMTRTEEQAFTAHLQTCAACRLKLSEIGETVGLLPFALAPAEPPAGLKERILRQIEAEPETRRRWRMAAPVWAAAAMVALVLGAYSLLRVEGLTQFVRGFQQAARVEQSIPLTGTVAAPQAGGRVLVAHEGGGTRISLQAQGLPTLQPGEAYQLWLIRDGKRQSGGVFVVDATGAGGVATWLPGAVEFDALGITREPDPYGTQPRGTKVMGSI